MGASIPGMCSFSAKLTCRLHEPWQLFGEWGQSAADRIPHHLEIQFEVTVGDAVAHAPHRSPRDLRVSA